MLCEETPAGCVWSAIIAVTNVEGYFTYKYAVTGEGGDLVVEEPDYRVLKMSTSKVPARVSVMDVWEDPSDPGYLLGSTAFTQVINAKKTPTRTEVIPSIDPEPGLITVRFSIRDWMLEDGWVLSVYGSAPQIGGVSSDGSYSHAHLSRMLVDLQEVATPTWEVEVRMPASSFPFQYKYCIHCKEGVHCEGGDFRQAHLGDVVEGSSSLLVFNDGFFQSDHKWRGAGVAAPVFSLRTADSVGAGDFHDLCEFADLANACGLRMLQLLPVNDTCVYGNWWDSYPYSSLSVYALHPLYLHLGSLWAGGRTPPPGVAEDVAAARPRLDLPQVDYEATVAFKLRTAAALFAAFGEEDLSTPEFGEWFRSQAGWLRPYAAFRFLQELHGSAEHWHWGSLARPTPADIDRLTSPDRAYHSSIRFTYYLQWHLHQQLLAASAYAAARRVCLKGDVPIGVDRRAADVWMEPGLFNQDCATGAPPDQFSAEGQNWGFPTYNWDAMAQDGFRWWRSRLEHMGQYFHAYRIDHILGFFRIWEIPGTAVGATLGAFSPSLPIYKGQLEHEGLWDIDRLCEPYIRDHILAELFGGFADEVRTHYLREVGPGRYALRSAFATEKAIHAIQAREGAPEWMAQETALMRRGLLTLLHNVCLLRDRHSDQAFRPRFDLSTTRSFRELPPAWRHTLSRLHDAHFYGQEQADFWARSAMAKLPSLLTATRMLVCGEDLGFVPGCVPPVMRQVGLLGLRIQRMSCQPGAEFNDVSRYQYLLVASPSCHDTSTTRGWWEEDRPRSERFFFETLGGTGSPPVQCDHRVVAAIVKQHLECPAMWAVFPLQDLLALSSRYTERPANEEAINDPTVNKHYWRYRCHVRLEDIAADDHLIALVQRMVCASHRCAPVELPRLAEPPRSDSQPEKSLDTGVTAAELSAAESTLA